MCGICGIINLNKDHVQELKLSSMMREMKHRGPDDEGMLIDNNFGFGCVRLSIIDLSKNGHQPMSDVGGRYGIVHNGEVYNYKEIRKELIGRGYRFRSNTDTEVILYSYIEWGESCLNKFNGMWAFAVYDSKTEEIFISRDRYGIKPLYYYQDKNKFIFASTISAILKISEHRPTPDRQMIYDYLVFNRTDHSGDTFFKEVNKLDPGHTLTIKHNSVEIKEWYDLKNRITDSFQNADEFRETFISSIGLRLQSDVPLGVCLSGGLDSSSIVSILLKNYIKKDLKTFSAVYGDGIKGDESGYINAYIRVLNNMHFIHPTPEMLLDDLPTFIMAHDEPTISPAAYAQYKVMELCKNHVVVTLDGQGSDEQLAGYHYSFGFLFKGLFRELRFLKLLSEMYHYVNVHRSLYGLKFFLYYFFPSLFRASIGVRRYLNEEFESAFSKSDLRNENLYQSINLSESLLNNFKYKLSYILKWEDRNSSWFSLESRVPFLDNRIVERTLSLPNKYLINRGMTKAILRNSMEGILPEKIRNRTDKMGFQTPHDEWFRQPIFRKYIFDLLNSKEFGEMEIIDYDKAKKLFHNHLDQKEIVGNEIWKWINLVLWFKEFIY